MNRYLCFWGDKCLLRKRFTCSEITLTSPFGKQLNPDLLKVLLYKAYTHRFPSSAFGSFFMFDLLCTETPVSPCNSKPLKLKLKGFHTTSESIPHWFSSIDSCFAPPIIAKVSGSGCRSLMTCSPSESSWIPTNVMSIRWIFTAKRAAYECIWANQWVLATWSVFKCVSARGSIIYSMAVGLLWVISKVMRATSR